MFKGILQVQYKLCLISRKMYIQHITYFESIFLFTERHLEFNKFVGWNLKG